MKQSGVYILECNNGRYYVGSTDDIDRRLKEHLKGKSKATQSILPVTLKKFIKCSSLTEARKLEYVIKKRKSRKYLEELIARGQE